ncbi:fatty acid desaturase family protein [Congregibacter litoralis]|uniref:Fatty acid desaturase n=1 Tax=Congregibacter litoralis KT71 TaxID=314285 RepID=A4A7F6_9GAMM|nr:fatty acid desaturase family protein [Congregibacter litoralis]EAQ98225.1 Fatty acid desaturase [Congregibacter litoralis KT71]
MKASDYLSREEIQGYTRRSDAMGLWLIVKSWLLIAAVLAMAALWTNPLTIVLAILLLGGQQLGLSILMHEAGHKTLFKNQRLNQILGQWLGAYPVLGDCNAYGASHREHHRLAGTDQDPDLPNYRKYPIAADSFRRKLLRDITGQTGIKQLTGLLSGAGNRIMMRKGEGNNVLRQGLIANGVLFCLLWLGNASWLYLLWVAAYLTSYPLVARIRQVAEHGNVTALYEPDPRGNTRTTRANWLERLVLCPHNVNFHIEHHLLPSVPLWQLEKLHDTLTQRGFYADYPEAVADGYWSVIKRVVPELDRGAAAAA